MLEKLRLALAAAITPSPLAIANDQPIQPDGRADLINIKVNGLDQAKQYAVWLTKGIDRTQPATAVRLVDCTSDHLKNIVLNKPDLSLDYHRIIVSILQDRGETFLDPPDPSDPNPLALGDGQQQ